MGVISADVSVTSKITNDTSHTDRTSTTAFGLTAITSDGAQKGTGTPLGRSTRQAWAYKKESAWISRCEGLTDPACDNTQFVAVETNFSEDEKSDLERLGSKRTR